MGIVKIQPDQSGDVEKTQPKVAERPYQSQFHSLIPESRINLLSQYVEGHPWTVNYYGQLLDVDNAVNSPDPGSPNLLQNYYKIKGVVLRVDGVLSDSYNQEQGVTRIMGSAVIPKYIKPNVGDCFIAQVDNGEDAIFVINTVERLSSRKETLYSISYTLFYYVSENTGFLNQLEERVNDTHYYREDPNYTGTGNLVTPTVKEASERLDHYFKTSSEYYFAKFYNIKHGTFIVPGQTFSGYDPIMIRFLNRSIDMFTDHQARGISRYNHGNNLYIDQFSILDVISRKNKTLLSTVNKTYSFVRTGIFRSIPRLASISFSTIERMLFPMDPDKTSQEPIRFSDLRVQDDDPTYPVVSYREPVDENVQDPNLPVPIEQIDIEVVGGTKPLLHPLFEDGYYIVTKNFYDHMEDPENVDATDLSFFEMILAQWINNEAVSMKDLVMCIKDFDQWPWLHQFYLLPVLWVMIRNQRV